MDTGLNIRPVQPVSIAPVRMSPPVERQAAASELPETQAVTAVAEDASVRSRQESQGRELRAELNSAFDRKADVAGTTVSKVIQDETTKELVFRKISAATGEIVGQFPEEAMLRLKAYNAQQEKRAEAEAARVLFA
jgi:uncharacterized FlaG/YvyC family protein